MKFTSISYALLSILLLSCSPAENKGPVEEVQEEPTAAKTEFDAELAAQYGADDYGMRQYVMAFLRAGPNRGRSEEEASALQKGHMENISRLANEGKLAIAGPFMDKGDLRGIYIFNVETIEEAKALTETDPAIQEGSLVMELKPWYGSAALIGVNAEHQRISKVKF